MIKFVDQVNNNIVFGSDNLPLLVSGKEGSGASFFSIALISSFFLNGKKVIFFSKSDEARNLFLELAKPEASDYVMVDQPLDILNVKKEKIVFIKSGDVDLFKEALARINDLNDRVIFVKNLEEMLDFEIFNFIFNNQKLILSGDLDRSLLSREICKIGYETKIFFSAVEKMGIVIPQVPRQQAILVGGKQRGRIIKVIVEKENVRKRIQR
jgi:hypothetical protein